MVEHIGLDAGCAFSKAVWLDDAEQWQSLSIPSLIRPGRANITLSGNHGDTYTCGNETWTVDANAVDAEDTRFDSYPYSSLNTVMTYHLLKLISEQTPLAEGATFATGVPLSHFFDLLGVNKNTVLRKKNALINDVKPVAAYSKPLNTLAQCVQVCPEGMAAWVDMRVDRYGNEKTPQRHAVAGADIGGRTTDIFVIQPDYSLIENYTGTINIGYLDVVSVLNQLLSETICVGRINIMAMYQVIDSKTLDLGHGQVHDVTEQVEKATEIVAGRITREVERRTGSVPHLDARCFFGGGAERLRAYLTGENIIIPPEPRLSNPRGYWKIKQFF